MSCDAVPTTKTNAVHKSIRNGAICDFLALLRFIFLYRQALELILKAIIVAGAPAIDDEHGDSARSAVYKQHNFEKLRPWVEAVMEVMGLSYDFGVPHLRSREEFRKILADFDQFDPTSTVCRYPVDAGGNPSIDGVRCFNLFTFSKTLDGILEALSVAPGVISAAVEQYSTYLVE